mgnify:CR=1 FL=1
MAKRRTKADVSWNEILLSGICTSKGNGKTATITFRDLHNLGWRGSMPYCTPMTQGKYMIKQDKRKRGLSPTETTYSIVKLWITN